MKRKIRVLKVHEIAKVLDYSPSTIYRLIQKRRNTRNECRGRLASRPATIEALMRGGGDVAAGK
jgi:transposase